MESFMSKVYKIYCYTSPSGKYYIGTTCQRLERRARGGKFYKECRLFYEAILKYGWENFTVDILDTSASQKEAFLLEQFYISQYHSNDSAFGYNLASGGTKGCKQHSSTVELNSLHHKGKRHPISDETKKKISKAHIGKPGPHFTEAQRKKFSEQRKGIRFSPEHRKHISECKKGVYVRGNNPKARKVVCVETGVVFDCLADAGEWAKCSSHNISSVCTGHLKTSGGYHWKYLEV